MVVGTKHWWFQNIYFETEKVDFVIFSWCSHPNVTFHEVNTQTFSVVTDVFA